MRSDLVALLNEFNGNIDNSNLKATAGITESKMATGASGPARGAFQLHLAAASTTVAFGASTVVPFDTAGTDVSGWATTGATARFTPQVAGWWWVYMYLVAAAPFAATEYLQAIIGKNGAALYECGFMTGTAATAGFGPRIGGGALVQMNGSTDFIQALAGTNRTANYALQGISAPQVFTRMTGVFIGPS